MPRYLITVTDAGAEVLESWLGGRVDLIPAAGPPGAGGTVPVAGLDAVFDDELEPVLERFRTGGPRYHKGGPGRRAPIREDTPS